MEEKPGFRERLIPALASTPPNVRAQLVPLLQKILQHDFPEQWPNFLDITLQLLGTNDANSVYAGLQCLLAICRVYRFKGGEKRDEFDKIVEHSFPQLLNIGLKLVDEESLEAAEMLRIVVKSYKHAIYVGEPTGTMCERFGADCWASSNFRPLCKHTRRRSTGARCSCASLPSIRLPIPCWSRKRNGS